MHIGIDARLFGLQHTGIGRYVMELVSWIIKLDQKTKFTIFTTTDQTKHIPRAKNVNIIPVDIRHYTLQEQIQLPKIFHQQSLDLIHIPHFNAPLFLRIPFVVTIHDLLWHEVMGYQVTTLNPLVYTAKYLGYRLVVKNAINKSQKIITPSKWVKNKILDRFSVDAEKITVANEGINKNFTRKKTDSNLSPSLKRSTAIEKPFLVYTGSLYPHKNIKTLIKALKIVNKQSSKQVSLAIVSARSIFTHKTRQLAYKHDQEHHVKFLGFLSDIKLSQLYQHALALVQPSTSEGFGLTGLEAMAVGVPVISSHAAALPEIYEEAALYFNPKSSKDLSQKINQLLNDKNLQNSLGAAGKKQVKKYSWRKMAQEILEIYRGTKK